MGRRIEFAASSWIVRQAPRELRAPALSVLMPLRNEERHLPEALASMARQTHEDWELIALDDGSTDATARILAQAAARDRRIRPFKNPGSGLVTALNFGLGRCASDLVARMDGDDISHPRRFEKQIAHLNRQPQTSLVACGFRHFPRPAITDGMLAYELWQNRILDTETVQRDLFVESPFVHPSVMYRKEAVLQVGGYRDMGWAEDYDLWLRLAGSGHRMEKLPECLFFWRDRAERLTRTAAHCSLDAFRACKAHHLKEGYLKGVRSVCLWGAGDEGKAWRKALEAEGIGVHRWIEVHPGRIGQRIAGARVESYETLRPGCGPLLLCIGTKGARQQVRDWTRERGILEGRDFICVT